MIETSPLINRRKRQDRVFNVVGVICTLVGIVTLTVLLCNLAWDGREMSFQFFTSFPSRFASRAGILSAWVGTLAIMFVTFLTAVPLGISAAVYLEEYASKNWVTTLIEVNISNLAGVPSIIYGLMALGILGVLSSVDRSLASAGLDYVHINPGPSILIGGITLALLILPIVIVATREAIRSIPSAIREAAYACGATKWQVIRFHLLPYSLGGIATGTIIALSRAIGETAPLITIGALTYIAFLPPSPIQGNPPFVNFEWLTSDFTVLPIQMFNWVSRPSADFHRKAAATGLVLITFTLSMNSLAMWVRYRMRKRIKW